MPEVSQDAFEANNPVKSTITPEVLRARANSNSKKKPILPCEETLKRLSCNDHDLESFTGGMPSVENIWIDRRELSHRYFKQKAVQVSRI